MRRRASTSCGVREQQERKEGYFASITAGATTKARPSAASEIAADSSQVPFSSCVRAPLTSPLLLRPVGDDSGASKMHLCRNEAASCAKWSPQQNREKKTPLRRKLAEEAAKCREKESD